MRFADAERADADALAAALDAADEEYNEGRDAVKKSLKKAKSEKRMATVRKARERITEADFGSKATQRSICLLYTSPSPRDQRGSRMPSSA